MHLKGERSDASESRQDLREAVTVFVTTIGDAANFTECIAHLESQSVGFRLEIISHVAPLSAAFQRMHDRCETPYYIQVDEDMMLRDDAVATLYGLMSQAPERTAIVCAPLWDCDIDGPLYGLKIYRHSIVKQFPYEDILSCERIQNEQLIAAGYEVTCLPLDGRAACMGEHGKHYTPKSIFRRWQRLMQKRRRYGNHLARGVPGPEFLWERYRRDPQQLHLYALLGAMSGLFGELSPDRESDYREECPDFDLFDPVHRSGNFNRDRMASEEKRLESIVSITVE